MGMLGLGVNIINMDTTVKTGFGCSVVGSRVYVTEILVFIKGGEFLFQ